MLVIGLMGRAGAGKDTVADIFCEQIDAARFAFADRLKAEAAAIFRVDVRLFNRRDVKDLPIRQLALARCTDEAFVAYAGRELGLLGPLKPRTIMQVYGDFRRGQDLDYFVRPAALARLQAMNANRQAMVVTDVRFANEAKWVAQRGGVLWKIERAGLPPVGSHESEWSIRDLQADAVIRNDGTIDDLRRAVVDLLGVTLDREERA